LEERLIKFTLPSPTTAPSAPEPSPRGLGTIGAPKTRILVAEDDPVSRELISSRLKKWGYDVVGTSSGTEAMTVLRCADAPMLAILDWMMPGMDGLEVCRRMRATNRTIYIILLTAREGKESLIEGLNAGADDYLVKPFDKDELGTRILVGLRVMALQANLAARIKELEAANVEIESLKLQLPL
jgi:DNA-binding response OmpR family regulator